MTAVELQGVSRVQNGTTMVRDVSLSVPEGSTFALVGPNGSGKTTILRMLATIIRPSAGKAQVLGHDVVAEPGTVRQIVGYVPDSFGTYPGLKVREYLEFFASAHRLRSAGATITDLLNLVELRQVERRYLSGLSRGMKQRLAIARALLHDPAVLLLDEPTFGLDVRGRSDVVAVLKELHDVGKTLIISSHLLDDVAPIATDVAAISGGRLVASMSAEQLRRLIEGPRRIRLEVANDPRQAQAVLAAIDAAQSVEAEGQELTFLFRGSRYALPEVVTALVQREVKIIRFAEESNDLEVLLASLEEPPG